VIILGRLFFVVPATESFGRSFSIMDLRTRMSRALAVAGVAGLGLLSGGRATADTSPTLRAAPKATTTTTTTKPPAQKPRRPTTTQASVTTTTAAPAPAEVIPASDEPAPEPVTHRDQQTSSRGGATPRLLLLGGLAMLVGAVVVAFNGRDEPAAGAGAEKVAA